MKKQIFAIAVLSAVIGLTGCSININDNTVSSAKNPAPSVQEETVSSQTADPASASGSNAAVSTAQTASADIQGIVGIWNETDVPDSRTLTVNADGTYQLAYKGGSAQNGTVKAETAQNPDGSSYIWYNFYETDGKLWEGFQKHDGTQNDLYSGQDGAIHFVRAASANAAAADTDITPIVGEWYYQEQNPQDGTVYDNAGFVTICANCTYSFQPRNGSELKKGTIKVDYDDFSNGDKIPFFALYENDEVFWIGAYCNQNDPDIYYIGNGGTARLVRQKGDENPFDEYVGQWQCDRCTIRIAEQGAGYGVEIHWADSSSEDNVWTYPCTCSDDGTYMECLGTGTLTHIVTAEDGTEERTIVYNDGEAKFNIKGGTLFWQDCKEDKGHQMGFTKIG